MQAFLSEWYLLLRALHVISIIAWMAGLLYLPRLFVYHAGVEKGSARSETFKIMERRLLRGIMNPAMIASWILGLALLAVPGAVDWSDGWIHVKLTGVMALSGLHGALSGWRRAFEADNNSRSERFFRIVNEVPTVLMIVIVVMVVMRPF